MGPGPHGVRVASLEDPHGGDSTPERPHESGFWPRMFCRVERALLEVRGPCVPWASCAAQATAAALLASCGSSLARWSRLSTAWAARGLMPCERWWACALTLAAVARVSHLASAVRKSSSCDARGGRSAVGAVGRRRAGARSRWGAVAVGWGWGAAGARQWARRRARLGRERVWHGESRGRAHERGARGSGRVWQLTTGPNPNPNPNPKPD